MASQAGPQILGDYLLVDLVGEGGMAEVFRAQYQGRGAPPHKETEVVLKRIKPELFNAPEFPIFREMFLNEAKLVHGLQHPNLARMHTLGEGIDKSLGARIPFIVGEYIRGRTLRKYLQMHTREFTGRGVPPAISAFIIREIARGLGAAHDNKDPRTGRALPIIHRDVAPDNVMISEEGHVKVIDFGVAKAIGGFGPQTQTGIIKGKLAYMAPEQVAQKVVPATDVFGAGIMLHEMLTGRRLFGGSNDFVVVSKVLKGLIPRPSELVEGIPKELEQVVMTALSRDLSVRYANGNAFADALTEVMKRVPSLKGTNERSIKRWTEELLAAGAFAVVPPPVDPSNQIRASDAYAAEEYETADPSLSSEIELSGEDVVFGGMDVNPAVREAVTQGLRVLNLEMMHKSSEPTQPVPLPLLNESTARFVPPSLHESDRAVPHAVSIRQHSNKVKLPAAVPAPAPVAIPAPAPPRIEKPAPIALQHDPEMLAAATHEHLEPISEADELPSGSGGIDFSPSLDLANLETSPISGLQDIVPTSGAQDFPDLGPAAAMRSLRYAGYAFGAVVIGIIILIIALNS